MSKPSQSHKQVALQQVFQAMQALAKRREIQQRQAATPSLTPNFKLGFDLNEKIFGNKWGPIGNYISGKPGGLLGKLIPKQKTTTTVGRKPTQAEIKAATTEQKPSGETIVSAPVVAAVASGSRANIQFAKAPSISGIDGGIRLTATFMGPNIVRPRSSSSGCPASAWGALGNATAPTMWLHLNFADDANVWLLQAVGAAGQVTYAAPLSAACPKLAAFARNFSRFFVRKVEIETIGRLGTDQKGMYRVSKLDDPVRALEIPDMDPVSLYGTSLDTAIAYLSDLQKGFEGPVWLAQDHYVIHDATNAKPGMNSLNYTCDGIGDTPGLNIKPGSAETRQVTPCLIGAVQDLGLNTIDENIILRKTWFTVVVDFYGLNLGTPSNGFIRSTRWFHAEGSVVLPTEEAKKLLADSQPDKADSKGQAPPPLQVSEPDEDIVLLEPVDFKRAPAANSTVTPASTPATKAKR